MGLINFKNINTVSNSYSYINIQNNFFSSNNNYNINFDFSSDKPAQKENLKLYNNRPEIASEAELSEEQLIKLKKSPARQELSKLLRECDSEEFSYQRSDTKLKKIIYDSGILGYKNIDTLIDKILIAKTQKILTVINGINQLDTANMSEEEMQSKVKEFSEILGQARTSMKQWRDTMQEAANLGQKIIENQNNNERNNISIENVYQKFQKLAQNGTFDSDKEQIL